MIRKKILDNVYLLAFNDRHLELFENLWKIPNGVSYNCYLILGETNVLIDTAGTEYSEELISNINDLTDNKGIDALVNLHAEPDHSSSILALLRAFPKAKFHCNKVSKKILDNYFNEDLDVILMADGDNVKIGEHEFQYYTIPAVHWPDSSVMYFPKHRTLFSNDAFGSFGALNGGVFDYEVPYIDREDEAMRYYTNIIGKFGKQTQKALAKIATLRDAIDVIAPSHGILWRDSIDYIINKYNMWSNYEGLEGATILYGSIYGHTQSLVEELSVGLAEAGVKHISIFDVSRADKGRIINEVFKNKAIVIAAPVYYGGIFPPMTEIIDLINHYGIQGRKVAFLGNFSWGPAPLKKLNSLVEEQNWENVGEQINVQGEGTFDDRKAAFELGKLLGESIK